MQIVHANALIKSTNVLRILGLDYGRSKVGVAIGVGTFAEPLKVIRYKDTKTLEAQIKKLIEDEKIDKVIVGISEGEMGEETKEFAEAIQPFISTKIEFYDETLTSKDAQRLSQEAGIPQKKRHQMEDAYAATIMLQAYLDNILIGL